MLDEEKMNFCGCKKRSILFPNAAMGLADQFILLFPNASVTLADRSILFPKGRL
jgi:hypothetical protein